MEKPDKTDIEKYTQEALDYASRSKLPQSETPSDEVMDTRNGYTGEGTLKVQVSTANGSFPVSGATVEVAYILGNKRYSLYNYTTNSSGIVSDLKLPAKEKIETQNEEMAEDGTAKYIVSVYHPAFEAVNDRPIEIYDGVETILPVDLLPLNRYVGGENNG